MSPKCLDGCVSTHVRCRNDYIWSELQVAWKKGQERKEIFVYMVEASGRGRAERNVTKWKWGNTNSREEVREQVVRSRGGEEDTWGWTSCSKSWMKHSKRRKGKVMMKQKNNEISTRWSATPPPRWTVYVLCSTETPDLNLDLKPKSNRLVLVTDPNHPPSFVTTLP